MASMEYWNAQLKNDDEIYLLEMRAWNNYWNNIKSEKYDLDVITYGNKGFLFIRDSRKTDQYIISKKANIHLTFAYVPPQYRGQGVLKNLMKLFSEKYPEENIDLHSRDEITNTIWEKFGFYCINRIEDECDEYLYEYDLTEDEIKFNQLFETHPFINHTFTLFEIFFGK